MEKARETEPFDPDIYDDDDDVELERQLELRKSAADLLLVERAKEWLLGGVKVRETPSESWTGMNFPQKMRWLTSVHYSLKYEHGWHTMGLPWGGCHVHELRSS